MIYFSVLIALIIIWYVFTKYPEQPVLERVSKIIGSLFFSLYILYRIQNQYLAYQKYPEHFTLFSWLNWILVMCLFVFFLVSYLIREAPKVRAKTWQEIVIPLICSIAPFVIVESPQWTYSKLLRGWPTIKNILRPLYVQTPEQWNPYSIILILVGGALTVVAMISLKKSFSILSEVRSPVFGGVYKYMRHPMYVGEFLSTIGLCFLSPSMLNIVVTALLGLLLYLRALVEEKKISAIYPDYQNYKTKVGLLFSRQKHPPHL